MWTSLPERRPWWWQQAAVWWQWPPANRCGGSCGWHRKQQMNDHIGHPQSCGLLNSIVCTFAGHCQ
jgi:hypothetical protein